MRWAAFRPSMASAALAIHGYGALVAPSRLCYNPVPMSKYIFVTGGVCSGLGKGVAAASLGSLLENRGFSVRMIKIDPYINVDAGTMNPYQHGEVYVTDDGAETDLDLGNYSRFTSSPWAMTTPLPRARYTRQ